MSLQSNSEGSNPGTGVCERPAVAFRRSPVGAEGCGLDFLKPEDATMRIAISLLNFRPGRVGGTETYLRQLVSHLAKLARPSEEIVVLADEQVAAEFDNLAVGVLEATPAAVERMRFLEATTGYRARSVERLIESVAPDVVLFPQQTIFPKRVDVPAVLVVHDLYHVHFPKNLSFLQRMYRNAAYTPAVRRADQVITVSDFTRRQVIEHYGIADTDRVHTVLHAAPEFPTRSISAIRSTEPFVYYPAVTHPHKDHITLLRTVAELHARGRFPYKLVLSGERTPHWRTLVGEIRRLGLENVVQHLGFIEYEEVLRLYQSAVAMVFPSQYEGFGLPVAEAASVQCKVITSDIDVFRELGVPDEFRLDFADADRFQGALESQSTARIQFPTWGESAEKTLEVLRLAAGQTATGSMEPASSADVALRRAA